MGMSMSTTTRRSRQPPPLQPPPPGRLRPAPFLKSQMKAPPMEPPMALRPLQHPTTTIHRMELMEAPVRPVQGMAPSMDMEHQPSPRHQPEISPPMLVHQRHPTAGVMISLLAALRKRTEARRPPHPMVALGVRRQSKAARSVPLSVDGTAGMPPQSQSPARRDASVGRTVQTVRQDFPAGISAEMTVTALSADTWPSLDPRRSASALRNLHGMKLRRSQSPPPGRYPARSSIPAAGQGMPHSKSEKPDWQRVRAQPPLALAATTRMRMMLTKCSPHSHPASAASWPDPGRRTC